MKHCPVCNNTYTDDSLRFCLQDGAALVSSSASTPSGSVDAGDLPTLVSGSQPTLSLPAGQNQSEPTLIVPHAGIETDRRFRPSTNPSLERKPRNTALVVVLTMLATLIVVAFAAGGAYMLFWRDPTGGQTDNGPNVNRNGKSPEPKTSPSPTGSPSPANSPTPSPTAEVDEAAIREQVTEVLNGWVAAARARDAATNVGFYADPISPYFNSANFARSELLDQRSRIYAMYTTIDIEMSAIKITPDATGTKATALFDKTWSFESQEKFSSGSVQSQMTFAKQGGRWLITSERDVKVYYKKN